MSRFSGTRCQVMQRCWSTIAKGWPRRNRPVRAGSWPREGFI